MMKFEEFVTITHDVLEDYNYSRLSIENGDDFYTTQATFSSFEEVKLQIPSTWNGNQYKLYLENYLKYIDI